MMQLIEKIKQVNYWQAGPQRVGFERDSYVQQIMGYIGSRLLKVLLGQRRSGKSTLLKQVIAKLIERGVPRVNILYLNFELYELSTIRDDEGLAQVIKSYLNEFDPQDKIYLFFDEIQEVDNWEKVVNSYLAQDKIDVDIFITGSNAHLLSTELSTYITDRYVEIPVFPFLFQEYSQLHDKQHDKADLIEFLEYSGMPEVFSLVTDRQKISYLASLKDSIIMNDVVKRYNIKNPKLLTLLLDFLIDNIGHLFSLNAIVNKLKTQGVVSNVVTIGNYVNYLERTFLIHAVERYDLKGRKILEGERKYYVNDLGFSNYLQSKFDNGVNRRLENYVYQELLYAGFNVHVGYIHNLEIDFVAETNRKIIYIQVTYLMHSEKVIDREYGNLEKIQDNWPKMVVSLDDVSFPEKNGIRHIQAWNLSLFLHRFVTEQDSIL